MDATPSVVEAAGSIDHALVTSRRSFLIGLGAFVAAPYVVDLKVDSKPLVIPKPKIRVAKPSSFADMARWAAGHEIDVDTYLKEVPLDYTVPLPTAHMNVRWNYGAPRNLVLSCKRKYFEQCKYPDCTCVSL
jgi:hypothetical protein